MSNTFICIIFSIRLIHAAQVSRSAWTNKRGRQTQTTAINFPRINVYSSIIIYPSIFHSLPFRHAIHLAIQVQKAYFPPEKSNGDILESLSGRGGCFNMWGPCAIVRGRSAADTSASPPREHYYSTIVADGYLKSAVSNMRFSRGR